MGTNNKNSSIFTRLFHKLSTSSALTTDSQTTSYSISETLNTLNQPHLKKFLGLSGAFMMASQAYPVSAQDLQMLMQMGIDTIKDIGAQVQSFLPTPAGVAGISDMFRVYAQNPHMPLRRDGDSPVANKRTIFDYTIDPFTNEHWVRNHATHAVVIGGTVLNSKMRVLQALALGEVAGAAATYHSAGREDPLLYLGGCIAIAALTIFSKEVIEESRKGMSRNWHRLMGREDYCSYLDGVKNPDVLAALSFSDQTGTNTRYSNGNKQLAQIKKYELLDKSTRMRGSQIGLEIGFISAISSVYFIGSAILDKSKNIEFGSLLESVSEMVDEHVDQFLEPLTYISDAFDLSEVIAKIEPNMESSMLSFGTVIAYVTPMTFAAAYFAKKLYDNNVAKAKANTAQVQGLVETIDKGSIISASGGEHIFDELNRKKYAETDRYWLQDIFVDTQNSIFKSTYHWGAVVVSWGAALPAYLANDIGFGLLTAIAELNRQFISGTSYFANVMDDLAGALPALNQNLMLAREINEAHSNPNQYFQQTGIRDIEYAKHEGDSLIIENCELYFAGHDAEPFLTIPYFELNPGDRVSVQAKNGAGKSCLGKVLGRVWPYVRGKVSFPEGKDVFISLQTPLIPNGLTFKELVEYPLGIKRTEADVENVLKLVGLGDEKFLDRLYEQFCDDASWDKSMSGGQKQALDLARAILRQPDIWLADEPTSAMDEAAVQNFYNLLEEYLPNTAFMAPVHGKLPPNVFNKILKIDNGIGFTLQEPHNDHNADIVSMTLGSHKRERAVEKSSANNSTEERTSPEDVNWLLYEL